MDKYLRTLLFFAFISMLCFSAPGRTNEATYIFAVVPQFTPTQINNDWTPLLTRLEEITGYHFQLRVYDKISGFETELAQGIPDFGFMNPYQFVFAKGSLGYRSLVRDSTMLSGILVARATGPINSLEDLNGKVLAFPAPNALGASLYMRALLSEEKGLKFTSVYVGNHQNVYRQVLRGDAAAGGGVRKTFDKEPESVRSKLRILYTTPELASHPLAAHPRVSAEVSEKIVAALLAMRNDPNDRTLLAAVQMPNIIEADFQRDYDSLARLKLDRYANKMGQ